MCLEGKANHKHAEKVYVQGRQRDRQMGRQRKSDSQESEIRSKKKNPYTKLRMEGNTWRFVVLFDNEKQSVYHLKPIYHTLIPKGFSAEVVLILCLIS